MGILVFVVMALLAAAAIAYPLLPGRAPTAFDRGATDEEIAAAVHKLRRERAGGAPVCRSCGQAYRPGDRFCVRCGASLPEPAADSKSACAGCGTLLQPGDQFCAKCGQAMPAGEAV